MTSRKELLTAAKEGKYLPVGKQDRKLWEQIYVNALAYLFDSAYSRILNNELDEVERRIEQAAQFADIAMKVKARRP